MQLAISWQKYGIRLLMAADGSNAFLNLSALPGHRLQYVRCGVCVTRDLSDASRAALASHSQKAKELQLLWRH